MALSEIRDLVLPRLSRARVARLTLTGGEPFVHPEIVAICEAAREMGLAVGICSNATCITETQMDQLVELGGVHVNVSLDGFRAESHGRFRGKPASFEVTRDTTRTLAGKGLLQGILSTPNALTNADEYRELASFAEEIGARYLLMNPLSAMGRGVRSQQRLAAQEGKMNEIRDAVSAGASALEVVPIRFPNRERAPLAPCVAGDVIYVFVDGAVAICPYLVFAARSQKSLYADEEFLIGNVLDGEIAEALDNDRFHERFPVGANPTCGSCRLNKSCGKGCPAAVVAAGGQIGELDREPCPV